MKKILIAVGLFVVFVGCQIPPQRIAYDSLKTVAETVDGGRKLAAVAYAEGKMSVTTLSNLVVMDRRFIESFNAAMVGARFDYSKPTPANVASNAAVFINYVTKAIQ